MKNVNKEVKRNPQLFFLVLSLFFLVIVLPAGMSDEGISFVRSQKEAEKEYYSVEDMIFTSCYEDMGKISHYFRCLYEKDKPLKGYEWNETCRISYIDLDSLSCRNFILTSRNDNSIDKFLKTVSIKKLPTLPKSLIEEQKFDGSWDSDPVKTAFNIWILMPLKEKYSENIEKALTWLKNNRNNDEKCWPSGACSVQSTAKVLAYLTLANYNNTIRIIHDSQAWINERQNYIENAPWTIKISSAYDTSCTYYYSGSKDISVYDNETYTISISPKYNSNFNISCDDTVSFKIYNKIDEQIFSSSSGSEINYTIPDACWSETKWGECSLETSLYAAITNLPEKKEKAVKDYFLTKMKNDPIFGKYVDSDNPLIDSALYVNYIDENQDVVDWLVYNQNNDGSWSMHPSDDKVIPTLWVLSALENLIFPPKPEVIEDGKNWIMSNYPSNGWEDDKKDALSYYVFKDKLEAYFKSIPGILVFNNSLKEVIEISNHNSQSYSEIVINASKDMKKKIKVIGFNNISAGISKNVTIIKKEQKDGNYYGFIEIFLNDEKYRKIPVIIYNDPYINLTFEKKLNIFGSAGKSNVNVSKSDSEFVCRLRSNSSFADNKTYVISDQKNIAIDINFDKKEKKTLNFSGEFFCKSKLNSFTIPTEFTIYQYPTVPFEINEYEFEILKRKDKKIKIKNLLEEVLYVSLKVENPGYFKIDEEEIILPARSSKDVMLINEVPFNINFTSANSINVKAKNYFEKVDFTVDLNDKEKDTGNLFTYFIIGLTVVLFSIIGVFILKNVKNRNKLLKKGKIPEKKEAETNKKQETKDKKDLLKLMMILKAVNDVLHKDKNAIKEELQQHGINPEELDSMINNT
ncbi:hypothetical protein GF327_03540 [Candidatus Woesearchaeota archaeon]|nr:hypothetical protein [Candidatus Woesearchaeota archaeon]